jgi:site-specific DNA recombinase
LKIVPEEAETVRTLYDLYLQHRSILTVVEHANRLGLRGKAKVKKRKEADKQAEGAASP